MTSVVGRFSRGRDGAGSRRWSWRVQATRRAHGDGLVDGPTYEAQRPTKTAKKKLAGERQTRRGPIYKALEKDGHIDLLACQSGWSDHRGAFSRPLLL